MALPARFLTGFLTINYPVDFNNDPQSPLIGAANKWAASVLVFPQAIGIPGDSFTYAYDGLDITVGDWIASSENGRALRVAEITVTGASNVELVLEDVDSYNASTDTTFTMDGTIPFGNCVVFTLNEFGFPVIGPILVDYFLDVAQGNLISRFNQVADFVFPGGGGGSDFLGTPTDGSYSDGALTGWQPGITKKDDAIDDLNRLLLRALPERPVNISDAEITFTNQPNGTPNPARTIDAFSWKLANGVIPNNATGKTFAYKDPIIPLDNVLGTTNILVGVGSGDSGTLSVIINGTTTAAKALTVGSDVGSYTGLDIVEDYPFPQGTVGIWEALDIRASATIPDGISEYRITHNQTGSTFRDVVVETLLDAPVITDAILTPITLNTSYSSGVPHIISDSVFETSMTVANLAGRTYVADNIAGTFSNEALVFTSVTGDTVTDSMGIDLTVNVGPVVLTWNSTLAPALRNYDASLDFFALNAFTETRVNTGKRVLIASDVQNPINLHENPTTTGVQTGLKRVALPNGDCPVVNSVTYATNWDSGSSSSLGDLQLWDAPIVAGISRANQFNYSVGFIPVGPDFSSKPTRQYLSFKTKRITNRLKLSIDGTYTGVFIKLPGITNDMPNAVNGWWNGIKQADNAPLDWPGHVNNGDGCLMSSVDGMVEFTFGNISSAASTDNVILIRFILTGDDTIRNIKILD